MTTGPDVTDDVTDLLDAFAADDAADEEAALAAAAADLAVAEAAAKAIEEAIAAAPAVPAIPPQPSESPAVPAEEPNPEPAPAELDIPAQPSEPPALSAEEPASAESDVPARPSESEVEELEAEEDVKHVQHVQRRPLPPGHVSGGGRLPAPGQVADLTKPDQPQAVPAVPPPPPFPPAAPAPAPVPAAADGVEEQRPGTWWPKLTGRQEVGEDTAEAAPAPAPLPPATGPSISPWAQHLGGDRSLRWIAFNGTAAAVGYGTGLVHWLGGIMPAAHDGPVGILSLALAGTGGWTAWKFFGHKAVAVILPYSGVFRGTATLLSAELMRRLAPSAAAWIDRFGTAWGLDPTSASLLLTAGASTGVLYLLVDRPARHQPALARWVLRIPLASTALACLLYAPGPIA